MLGLMLRWPNERENERERDGGERSRCPRLLKFSLMELSFGEVSGWVKLVKGKFIQNDEFRFIEGQCSLRLDRDK